MPRMIDANALMETLKIMREKNKAEQDDSIEASLIVIGIQEAYCSAIEAVQDAPTIDATLKEQEAVKPTWGRGKPFCGACGSRIHGSKFCGECGKPILWEGR